MLEAVWQGVVELGHGAVQAVQRDGSGSSSSAAVVEAAARSRRSSAPEPRDGRRSKASSARRLLHHSARQLNADVDALKRAPLSELEDYDWNRTKRYHYSGTNWPKLKVEHH